MVCCASKTAKIYKNAHLLCIENNESAGFDLWPDTPLINDMKKKVSFVAFLTIYNMIRVNHYFKLFSLSQGWHIKNATCHRLLQRKRDDL